MKKTVVILAGALVFPVACGGSKRTVKTQEERLEEQLALADEQIAEQEEQDTLYEEAESDSEKAAKFDKDHAKHELKIATNNAKDCPNTFEKEQLKDYQPGTAQLQITFNNDGSVKNVTLGPPYDGTTVGDCILRAFNAVFVKMYQGEEVTVNWEVELEEAKPRDSEE